MNLFAQVNLWETKCLDTGWIILVLAKNNCTGTTLNDEQNMNLLELVEMFPLLLLDAGVVKARNVTDAGIPRL
jgi:hypothetical protein